jgi:hypothetical protein
MVNYEKSIIYKLCCKDPCITDEYVGSTVNFTRRKASHKGNCYNENLSCYNLKVYQYIRECGGWDNWEMVEVERYCATDRKDLNARERFWLEELGATLNMTVPNRSRAEWVDVNKEKISEYHATYRQENKEKIATYRQENKEKMAEKVTCECGCIVRRYGVSRHRKTTKHKKLMEDIK